MQLSSGTQALVAGLVFLAALNAGAAAVPGSDTERAPADFTLQDFINREWRNECVTFESDASVQCASCRNMAACTDIGAPSRYGWRAVRTAPDGGWNALHDCQSNRNPQYEPCYVMQRDRSGFLKKAGLPDTLPPLSQYFPNAGQVCLRDSWSPTATYLVFDATVCRSSSGKSGASAFPFASSS